MMDELTLTLLDAYDTEELVSIFEIEPRELMEMLLEVFPEKYEENIYKITGDNNDDCNA